MEGYGVEGDAAAAAAFLLLALQIAGAGTDDVVFVVVHGCELTSRGLDFVGCEPAGDIACAEGAVCFLGLVSTPLCLWSR